MRGGIIMNIKQMITKARSSDAFIKLKQYYGKKSFMHISGVARLEMPHSSFIAWLLDKNSDHGLGYYAIKKLLSLVAISKEYGFNQNVDIKPDLLNFFVNESLKITSETTSVEKQINLGKTSKRLDIEILLTVEICGQSFILPIIIENKVNSKEHDSQTDFYHDWAVSEYTNDKYLNAILIYLTPNKNDKPSCDKFLTISYQNLTDYVIEPALKNCVDSHAIMIIKDYLRCLSYTSLDDMDVNDASGQNKGDIIMAYSEEEKQLLHEFWDNNKDLIYAVAESLDESEQQNTKIQTILKGVSNRDYSKYIYKGISYNKTAFVYAVISDYIKNNPHYSYNDLANTFDDKVVKLEKDVSDKKRFNKKAITLQNGDVVYVSNQIGSSEKKSNCLIISCFCDKITALGIPYSKM